MNWNGFCYCISMTKEKYTYTLFVNTFHFCLSMIMEVMRLLPYITRCEYFGVEVLARCRINDVYDSIRKRLDASALLSEDNCQTTSSSNWVSYGHSDNNLFILFNRFSHLHKNWISRELFRMRVKKIWELTS